MSKKVLMIIMIVVLAVVGVSLSVVINKKQNDDVIQNDNQLSNNENEKEQFDTTNKEILIAYFSQAGNTDKLANTIHEQVGGDLFRIEPVNPYPTNMQELLDYTEKEQDDGIKPDIKEKIENIDEYDTIFIGYPIWWYEVPQIIKTFLDQYDLSGKTIVPFNTHNGSGHGGTYKYIEEQEPNAIVLEGLPISGSSMNQDQSKKVKDWLADIGF